MGTTRVLEQAGRAALARSAVYRVLSQALAYPSAEGLRQLREEDLPLARSVAGALPAGVRAALEALEEAWAGLGPEEAEVWHGRIFSHVHSADCPAYETDYTAREVWRQGQELADLAGFYRAFGVEQSAERPDHVAVELEFLHLLTYKRAWAEARGETDHVEVCRAAEEAFLADHALRWMPSLAARLARLGGGGPYGAVGRLALALLRAEGERLGVEVTEEGPPPAGPAEPPAPAEVGLCEEGP